MLSERLQTFMMKRLSAGYLTMQPYAHGMTRPRAAEAPASASLPQVTSARAALPQATSSDPTLLYMHIPFCERLCPYCSFCRYPFEEQRARSYFAALRKELRMVAQLGYHVQSLYVGGGTPTILIDELAQTLDLAYQLFPLKEVSCETNPNHLIPRVLDELEGRVHRLSVGVQSFDDGLLKSMQRFDKYGSGMQILERLQASAGRFSSLNADMIFNFPTQTEDILIYDLAFILESGVSQTTFYPLMASPAVERQLAATLGRVDYSREARYYALISEVLAGASGGSPLAAGASGGFASKVATGASVGNPLAAGASGGSAAPSLKAPFAASLEAPYRFGSAWTFNASNSTMIDEYIVNYEEYPAIGAGGFSYLSGSLYANTFSVDEYIQLVNAGQMSVRQVNHFSRHAQMRYRFMMQLFGLRLDKAAWRRDFGVSVAAGLPAEYAFFKAAGALATNDAHELTLTAQGRYLLVALMREFFIGVNSLRDQARAALSTAERELLFG